MIGSDFMKIFLRNLFSGESAQPSLAMVPKGVLSSSTMKRFAIKPMRVVIVLKRMILMMIEARRGGVLLHQSPINSDSPTHLFLQSSNMHLINDCLKQKLFIIPEILGLLDFSPSGFWHSGGVTHTWLYVSLVCDLAWMYCGRHREKYWEVEMVCYKFDGTMRCCLIRKRRKASLPSWPIQSCKIVS